MNYLKLSDIKKQCRIDEYFQEDDELLTAFGNAAEDFLQAHLNMQLDDVVAENGGSLPDNLYVAMLIFVSYLYDQDGSGKVEDMPRSYFVLTAPYKNYTIA